MAADHLSEQKRHFWAPSAPPAKGYIKMRDSEVSQPLSKGSANHTGLPAKSVLSCTVSDHDHWNHYRGYKFASTLLWVRQFWTDNVPCNFSSKYFLATLYFKKFQHVQGEGSPFNYCSSSLNVISLSVKHLLPCCWELNSKARNLISTSYFLLVVVTFSPEGSAWQLQPLLNGSQV